MKKSRPHDFCPECGTDLGENPPPLPRCKRCKRPVKGHHGPWGIGRCKAMVGSIALDKFFQQTIKNYSKALDKLMFEESPTATRIATLSKKGTK